MVYEFLGRSPSFDESVFIAPSADLVGDVVLGPECSVWFNTTIRGDVNFIRIGARTNVQDNVCIHVMNATGPTRIGDDVSIGHNAMVHGCTIADRVLIGIQATVLDQAVIEPDVIVAAGSLVPPGKVLRSGFLYMGSPAKPVRPLREEDMAMIRETASRYITYSRAYKRLDTYPENPFYTPE